MLELRQTILDDDYCKKWKVKKYDYFNLYYDGVKVSDNLYRVGGFGFSPSVMKNDSIKYFMLLKYVEAYYDDYITKVIKDKPHLDGQSCIIDEYGNEKVIFDKFKHPYLKGGVIYVIDNKYYNIESGEFYCNSYTSMDTNEYLFLDNKYDNDKSKRGVMKINKNDGTFEVFKLS